MRKPHALERRQPLVSDEGGRRVLFVSGEDADAKKTVSDLAERLGFAAVDLGGESQGRLVQFPSGPPAILNLVKFR